MDPGPVASFKKAANFPRSTNPWVVTLWRTKNRWFQTAARQKQLVQPKNRFKNRLVQQITNKTRKSPLFIKHVFFPTESQLQQKNTTPLFFTPTLCYLTFFFLIAASQSAFCPLHLLKGSSLECASLLLLESPVGFGPPFDRRGHYRELPWWIFLGKSLMIA